MLNKLWEWLGGTSSPPGEPRRSSAAPEPVWLETDVSPFGIRVLDCRAFTASMHGVKEGEDAGRRFAELRESDGSEHRGHIPVQALFVDCDLRYQHEGDVEDGPLHWAETLEDRWDLCLYQGWLYMARSSTGELAFKARVSIQGDEAAVSRIVAASEAVEGDAELAVRQVDFLIKSHLYGIEVPHPLPRGLPDEPKSIALYSYSEYGRRAAYAAHADTVRL